MQIGIVTMFYNSDNYGGVLQSYALVKAIEKLGMNAEQICYNHYSAFNWKQRAKKKLVQYISLIKHPSYVSIYRLLNKRKKAVVKESGSLVKHSRKVYNEKTISNCIENYDAFITGSDQVWHGEWPAYFLTFVPKSKRKISYAASTGKSILTEDEIKTIGEKTKDFTAISVREADIAEQLQKYMPDRKIELVLDPTLLLDQKDWDEVASERLMTKPYVFCYFLGSDSRMRTLAFEYAKNHELTLVTIPHMQQKVETDDLDFGDVQAFETTPQDFLSYIKNAEAVFTDSFHASVFSQIFNKQYYVFGRLEHKEMNNRINTLTEMFDSRSHFIEDIHQYQLEYIDNITDIDYGKPCDKYEKMREKSIAFLYCNLI